MFKTLLKTILFCLPLLASTAPSYGSSLLGPNIHEVDRGRFYRSAQLDKKEFTRYIQQYGIRTIINLRGPQPEDSWYQEEKAVAKKFQVEHYDISMRAKEIPHRENLIKLLDLYKNAPRPILVHCQGGADRSGEAAALYQMLYNNKSREEALKMLTFRYYHIRKAMPAKRYFIKHVWQGEDWAYQSYNPCQGQYKYYNTGNQHCQK